MQPFIITNNRLVYEKYNEKINMIYFSNYTYLQILEYVRDQIHEGHKLLTHPLYGSIKPNETPFRTIAVSDKKEKLDFDSLSMIEKSIDDAQKFIKGRETPLWAEKILNDFSLIDLSLIESAIEKMNCLLQ